MSKEGERASVLKTTKVRTKLKGDGSWMQRLGEPQSETEEEKPWIAEVRVNRLNGAPIDTSPVASPTSKTPPSPRPAEDGTPSPGYLIRGIFTKTDTKPAATSSTFNSLSVSTSSFTKRPSESYKRIAPHTVRPTSNLPVQTEDQLSPEEKEKREEAAMDVLRTSSARQRSYVLSAAKKYDSTEKPLETSLTPEVSSFVAKRVVITDNDDSVFTETPSVPKEPAAPSVKDVSPVSLKDVSPVSVKEVSPVSLKTVSPVSLKDVSPVSVKDVSPVSVKAVSPVSAKDVSPVSAKAVSPVSLKDVSPVSVKAVSPVPVKAVSPVPVKAVSPVPVKDVSPVSLKDVSPVSVKDVSPVSVKDVSPVSVKAVSPVPVKAVSPVPVKDVSPVSVKDVSPVSVKAVSPVSVKAVSPVPVKDVSPVPVKDVSPVSVKDISPVSVKTVSPVSVKAVSPVSVKDVSPISVKDVLLPAPVIVDTPTVIGPYEGMKPGCTKMATPLPELKVEVMKKLSPESGVPLKDVPPVPSVLVSPVPYNPVKKNPATVDTLTALSDTLISFDTGSSRVHDDPIPQLMTDDLLSLTNGLEQELVKPIPPIPGSWSQELLYGSDRLSYAESEEEEEEPRDEKPEDTHRDIDSPTPSTDSSVNENVLEDLEDDFIPINTNTTRHTWKRSWDVNPITTTDKSEEEEPEEQDPQVSLVTVQKQSSDSESPWDRWSAPTVCKEKRDPEPSMERSSSYSRTLDSSANQRPTSPDTESKKGFVYLKEYVNATDLTKHNTRDNVPDYVTSSSTSHSYSSPSSYTR
ncbi:mucin-4-like [Oncorhynchus keta]|uniref:mucin-4-like n=1 Tax=Oncorhynchus keta TaxID=8018 RepID=UPI00227C09D8|nr:mucin-4-like [Oncorhynchus keta]XP_052343584.1 mucin-4-like [Oncorhynchus keta]XP_052343585.1 mucin-4-like [Oncorhynchus keta]XP_052343586.1 mucin-4-like [Oncorhynchus keta]XP_052343587.1 mucin-4-like [Oncorhynchus keta]XP_052343588.1 mucin-4-like [Oncorhynchus keta]XP_052343589.1 mucin-4-like [Oncorhynchus keta]XP_052343590.1 mucin-4-like [Oncorhynchus keta]XP_052343591.1 mucin-4-like [Oncorhynchus keta]XP_052343592.1 mucin-4-like [Oncorhynchus keta]XP_052343594.1 mucin-4-like [Oncorh